MEEQFGGWSLEDWDNYLTREEEKLEQEKQQSVENLQQRKREFDQKCDARLAKLEEDSNRRRQFEQHLQERESRLKEKTAHVEEERRQFEKQMEDNQARLDRRKAELQRRLEEVERQHRELDIQEEALNKFLAMKEEQLQKHLVVRPDRNKNKNYDAWDLSPVVWVIFAIIGLAFLVLMCTVLPDVYLQYIVVALAVLWAVGSVVLSFRIFERFRGQKTLSHHAARLAFLCFTLLGLYVLYLITVHLDDNSSRTSLSSASTQ